MDGHVERLVEALQEVEDHGSLVDRFQVSEFLACPDMVGIEQAMRFPKLAEEFADVAERQVVKAVALLRCGNRQNEESAVGRVAKYLIRINRPG